MSVYLGLQSVRELVSIEVSRNRLRIAEMEEGKRSIQNRPTVSDSNRTEYLQLQSQYVAILMHNSNLAIALKWLDEKIKEEGEK